METNGTALKAGPALPAIGTPVPARAYTFAAALVAGFVRHCRAFSSMRASSRSASKPHQLRDFGVVAVRGAVALARP